MMILLPEPGTGVWLYVYTTEAGGSQRLSCGSSAGLDRSGDQVQAELGAVAVPGHLLEVGDGDHRLRLDAGRVPGRPLIGQLLEIAGHREPSGVASPAGRRQHVVGARHALVRVRDGGPLAEEQRAVVVQVARGRSRCRRPGSPGARAPGCP